MSKPLAIPLLLAGIITLCFALPGLLHPNPANPTAAHWLAAPALAAALTALCILTNIITLPRKSMHTLPTDTPNQFLLLPTQLRSERIRNALILLLTIALPTTLLALHLELTLRPVPPVGHLLTATATLLLLLHSLEILRRSRSTRIHNDLRLTITPSHLLLNEPFHIHIELQALQPLHIQQFRARILCFEHALMHVGRYVHLVVRQRNEIIFPLPAPPTLSPSQTLSASAQPLLDSIQYPPSGQWAISMYPFYRWEIHIELTGTPSLAAIYPITIHRPPTSP